MKKLLLILLLAVSLLNAQEEEINVDEDDLRNAFFKLFNGLSISGQWFLGYQNGENQSQRTNEFLLKRGYLTIEKKFNKNISARVTQDISLDRDGDGEGDVELRLKYLYLRYSFNDFWFLSKPFIEFGLVRRTFVDFEQKINNYRVQGPMFLDRYRLASSADYGVIFVSNLGGSINAKFKEDVNSNYAGRYGSFALGVFNGGGYHAIENNNNKIFEGRLSIRPLPDILPGLQFTYNGLWGKGNVAAEPEYKINNGFVSFEHQRLVLTAQYYDGKGLENGTAVDALGKSFDQNGFSFFGELKLHEINISLIGRYDRFKQNRINSISEKEGFIAGIAYHFLGSNKILLDFDQRRNTDTKIKDYEFVELAVELRF